MKHFIITIFCLIPIIFSAQAAKINGVLVEYEGKKFESIISSYNQSRANKATWEFIGPNTNIYFIQGEDVASLFDHLEKQSGVVAIQYSHETELRKKPNDPRQSEQYYLSVIKAFDAWDFTTGGTTFDGKDIVIAVIDDGFDLMHEDLTANIYVNPDEIPNDGIDNDNNGYKDDVNGWNIKNNTNTLEIRNHGTNVIGMLGAAGNNGKGITSINWNIKILPLNIENTEPDVIKAYEFILSERQKYNASNGTKGANILVSSYSGGIANGFEKDHLVWCNLYNKLGSTGVLNVGATTNEPENVDELGDIPSTCSSPYLLIVNSTDKTDEKTKDTGYGSLSVDISAPGEKILTTYPTAQGSYKEASGTSLATPIVAAAAALLHSSGCENFQNLIKNAPSTAVLAIKDALMNSVDKKNSLDGKTVSGGRLNIFEALQLFLKDNCETVISPRGALSITKANMILTDLLVEYQSPNQDEITLSIFDTAGKQIWTQKITPPVIGEKVINIKFTPETPGIYFISLITESDIATKGFYANFLK
jgi:subtilisin family serine protease